MSYTQYAEPYPASRGDRFGATAGRVRPHRGQDTAPGGLPVIAVARGTVVRKIWSNELGNVTVLSHADGKFSGYAHAASASSLKIGDVVERLGSLGANLGSTGSAADGRHLHYTIGDDVEGVISGHVQDPLAWINAHSGPETHDDGEALYSATAVDGIPGTVFWKLMQKWGKLYGGYAGPLDGALGIESWKAIQRNLARESGYTGPIDGKPGENTYKAIQRWAARYGYTGPVDGKPGENTWRAIATALNTLG